jgi:hypothetical protein
MKKIYNLKYIIKLNEIFIIDKDNVVNIFKVENKNSYSITIIQKNISSMSIVDLSLFQFQLIFDVFLNWLSNEFDIESPLILNKTKSVNKL